MGGQSFTTTIETEPLPMSPPRREWLTKAIGPLVPDGLIMIKMVGSTSLLPITSTGLPRTTSGAVIVVPCIDLTATQRTIGASERSFTTTTITEHLPM